MRFRFPSALSPLPLLALLLGAGCGGAEPPALRAGDVAFTEDQLLGLSGERRAQLGVLAALGSAVARGDSAALVAPMVRALERAWLERALDARQALSAAAVGDEMLRARYRSDPALELTVRHLIVMSPRYETAATRSRARARAQAALGRIRAGEPMPVVAAQVSEEPGADGRQGLLAPGREGSWVPEFWNAALALDPGETSAVVETEYGFHVLHLEARDTVPFEEARSGIELDVAAMLDPDFDRDSVPELPPGLALLPEVAARATDPAGAEDEEVARWDGGALTLGEYRMHLAALERSAWERATTGSEAERRGALEIAVAVEHAVARAEAAGIEVPAATSASFRDAWIQTMDRWAQALGFAPGLAPDEVGARALAALATTGQGAALVRDEVERHAPLLRRAVPVEIAPS